MVFIVFGWFLWFFKVISWFWVGFKVFYGSFMVFGWFSWVFRVVSWFFMVLR